MKTLELTKPQPQGQVLSMIQPEKRVKAYSYIRFSTPEQRKGDSLRRQTELSDKFIEEHNLSLVTDIIMNDEGLSAYHGTHRTKGALGAFLQLIEAGKIERGS